MPPAPGRHDPLAPFRDRCRSCRAEVLWATTANDKPMPVNPTPTSRGNVTLTVQQAQPGTPAQLLAGVLGRNQAAGAHENGVRLYTSHFVDCKDADRFRRRSRRP